ncbi:MAG TPA: hypothetical protein VFO40_07300, partial [Chthoniobacterales bacterium]|nr:hypothetical protein [Chthoniobacterales bacterium]
GATFILFLRDGPAMEWLIHSVSQLDGQAFCAISQHFVLDYSHSISLGQPRITMRILTPGDRAAFL